ncbi:MAG TPA: hypothetical protein VEC16_01945 [Alphaproteobacteria bacterium]|nr:hypothetical protein [Alphaproteobacteria bacterium]
MAEHKEHGIFDMIKEGLRNLSQSVASNMFQPIVDKTEAVVRNVEDRLLLMEKRLLKKMFSAFIIGFGGLFLVFSLLFFLMEYLEWSTAGSFFTIGIIIFVTGIMLRAFGKDTM